MYSEFKQFFPNNAVEYFVSYYDYYQPEAFMPVTGVFIEKDLSINEELEKMRMSTVSSLLSGRRDIIVISSVSCLYGIGNPIEFQKNVIPIEKGQIVSRTKLLHQLDQHLKMTLANKLPIESNIHSIIDNDIPYYFSNKIEEVNAVIGQQQLEAYDQILNILRNISSFVKNFSL